jgi:hypothetical protein
MISPKPYRIKDPTTAYSHSATSGNQQIDNTTYQSSIPSTERHQNGSYGVQPQPYDSSLPSYFPPSSQTGPANFGGMPVHPPTEAPGGFLFPLSGHWTNSMMHPLSWGVDRPLLSSAYHEIQPANGAVSYQPSITADPPEFSTPATISFPSRTDGKNSSSHGVMRKGGSRVNVGNKVRQLLRQLRQGQEDPQKIVAQWQDVDGKVTLLLPDGESASARLDKVWRTWSLLCLDTEDHKRIRNMNWSTKRIIDFLEYTHGKRHAVFIEQCTPQMGPSGFKFIPSLSAQQQVAQTKNSTKHKRRQADRVAELFVLISSDDFLAYFETITTDPSKPLANIMAKIDEVTGLIRTELLDLCEIASLSLPKKAEEGA